jgi:CBS domain-containing protein
MRRLSDIICNQKPVTMAQTASVQAACREMRDHRVGSVLVTDEDGMLVGIFTGRDAVCNVVAAGRDPVSTPLKDVMTAEPVTMGPEKSAIDALRLMWDGGFRHVPLIKGEMILGVISRGDFQGDEHSRLEEERELWEHMR